MPDAYPPIDLRLLDLLRQKFPAPRCRPESNERQDVWQAGARSVVEFLEQVHLSQTDDVYRRPQRSGPTAAPSGAGGPPAA